MNKFFKVVNLFLLVLLLTMMTGCSSKSPESYVSDYLKLEVIRDKVDSIETTYYDSKYELKKEIKQVIKDIKKIKLETKEGKKFKKCAVKLCKKIRYYGSKYYNDDPILANMNLEKKINKYINKLEDAGNKFDARYDQVVSNLYFYK